MLYRLAIFQMARAKSKSICFAESREKYYDSTATPNGKK
jgi:hypothetical protein